MEWRLADAKNRFSELMNNALQVGPQHIRRRNDEVVVISVQEYQRLIGEKPSFKEYLMLGEDFDDLDLSRDRSPSRDVVL